MKLPQRGLDEGEVFRDLEAYREHDTNWREGKTWGYVFDAGRDIERVQKRAYELFLSENALDPTVYPSLCRIENEIVGMLLEHLAAPESAVGTFTSGGTESILLAVKATRDAFRARHPEIEKPEILLPESAHAAFHKAAHYLDLDVVLVPVDPVSLTCDAESMRARLSPRTMLLVGSAPSYSAGVMDPIQEIAKLAETQGIYCHVDACMGGFLLPYFRRLGRDIPPFAFDVPGVTSLSVDLHKYAYAAKGASLALFRDGSLKSHATFSCSSWLGYTMVNQAVQSTKSGGPMAAAWAVLRFVGDSGYEKIARDLLGAADALRDGIRALPELRLLGDPRMTLFACASDTVSVFHVCDEMKQRGWYVQPQLPLGNHPASIHLSLNPSNVPHVPQFLRDLSDSVARAKELPSGAAVRELGPMLSQLDPAAFGPEMFAQLLGMAGLGSGTALPERMAEINELLAALPIALRERLLTEFVGMLFRPLR
jgi:glutamate/tyrosine decarboxylase-like PLP-dependent enzyme